MLPRLVIRMSFTYDDERTIVIEKDWLEAVYFSNRLEQENILSARRLTIVDIVDRATKDVAIILRKLVAEKLDNVARRESVEKEDSEDVPIE